TDPTTAMNMTLALMAKAFKLNYSTPTKNNHRILSNPHNRQIAQPGMNMGQDKQMQMVGGNGGNHFRQHAGQNVGNLNGYNDVQNVGNQVIQNAAQNPRVQNVGNHNGLIGVPVNANHNSNENGNLVAVRTEGNATGHNVNRIRCYNCRGVGSIERLASPKPSKPRSFLRWSPTGRLFDLKGKIIISSESESQSDCSYGDNACTSNPLEPKIKWFPNSTSFLGRVYFVEGLCHNLFSVGQFCDSDLEVVFRRNTCFVRNLEGVDLLKGNRTTDLYTINLHEMASASPTCLMDRASSTKSWLWNQRLSHLNFDTINDLAKNDLVSGLPKFKYHKEHLCPSSGTVLRAADG
nr:retrovirus-related Pol polyprotein from transposon TNT 1-94 [Tanacetum cinerariifolium]